jgi:signal transduction histidine kinase
VSQIPGLCTDDLAVGEHLRLEIARTLTRATNVSVAQSAISGQARLAFARDLHDSVIQLLAGTSFRLEGIRNLVREGGDPGDDIDALQQELSTEQRDLRAFIRQLRNGEARTTSPSVCEALVKLLGRMERQWNAECILVRCPENLRVPSSVEHDLHQLVREGIANAARHGRADRVSISLDAGEAGLSLIIADNGSGFGSSDDYSAEQVRKPWSLNERVHQLGGTLTLFTNSKGTRITISLPTRMNQ